MKCKKFIPIEKELKEFLYPFPKKVESKIENTIN